MSMSVDEMIVVLQGYKAGKQVQLRVRNYESLPWCDCGDDPQLVNFLLYDYRVKPEPPKPREWWAEVTDNGMACIHNHSRSLTVGGRLIRVREVLE